MRDSDYPLFGDHYWKSDRRQGQYNRSARDGEFLLPRIIEEFGDDPFTEEDYLDAFSAYVKSEVAGRQLNVKAALKSLVDSDYTLFEDGLYQVTDSGRAFADQLDEDPDPELDEDSYD
jgi:hypothetical protein